MRAVPILRPVDRILPLESIHEAWICASRAEGKGNVPKPFSARRRVWMRHESWHAERQPWATGSKSRVQRPFLLLDAEKPFGLIDSACAAARVTALVGRLCTDKGRLDPLRMIRTGHGARCNLRAGRLSLGL